MLNIKTVSRSVAARDAGRLVRVLQGSGIRLGPEAEARLARGWVAPAALAFRRLLEVTHRPSVAADAMLQDLLAVGDSARGGDGGVGGEVNRGDGDPVTGAAVLSALSAAVDDPRFGLERPALEQAVGRGRAQLAAQQGTDGGMEARADVNASDRLLTSTLVVWLIGGDPRLTGILDGDALTRAWDRQQSSASDEVRGLWAQAVVASGGLAVRGGEGERAQGPANVRGRRTGRGRRRGSGRRDCDLIARVIRA